MHFIKGNKMQFIWCNFYLNLNRYFFASSSMVLNSLKKTNISSVRN